MQMLCLQTLLSVNAGHESSKQLLSRLEDFLISVFGYNPATSDAPDVDKPQCDSGVLRPLWKGLEMRAAHFEGYPNLLLRALSYIKPGHPYLGPTLAQGMPDAAAMLTHLASLEVEHHQKLEQAATDPEQKAAHASDAKRTQSLLQDGLRQLQLRLQPSRAEEQDRYGALSQSMSASRRVGTDWTGFLQPEK